MNIKTVLAGAALAALLGASAIAQTAATPAAPTAPALAAPKTPAAPMAAPMTGGKEKMAMTDASKKCSDEADAKSLHGKARKAFRSKCKAEAKKN